MRRYRNYCNWHSLWEFGRFRHLSDRERSNRTRLRPRLAAAAAAGFQYGCSSQCQRGPATTAAAGRATGNARGVAAITASSRAGASGPSIVAKAIDAAAAANRAGDRVTRDNIHDRVDDPGCTSLAEGGPEEVITRPADATDQPHLHPRYARRDGIGV
ncbi:hypothetical protein, partial [Sinorhizobium meliloti]|uniref:hypothetical protein n=1 Tax=Rhizobium meliloti TaxID=382 RepID=UPI001F404F0C